MIATDTYYRGYRLSLVNGGDSAGIYIRTMGDSELLHTAVDEFEAHEVIDEWVDGAV